MFNFRVELFFKDTFNMPADVTVVRHVLAYDFFEAVKAAKGSVRRYGLYGAWAWSTELASLS